MTYLGNFATGASVYRYFLTVSSSGEASASTAVAVHIYRDNTTERTTEGITLTTPFAATTGAHMLAVSMASTFYTSGDYYAVLTAGTVDSRQLTGYSPACWSVKQSNRGGNVNMWAGSTVAAPSVAGVPEVDLTHIGGSTVSTAGAQLGVNVTRVHGSTAGSTDLLVSARLTATGVDDIWDEVVDGATYTGRQSQMLQNSAAAGLSSGAGTTQFTIRDLDNTQNRIVATVSTGDRTAVTLDVSS